MNFPISLYNMETAPPAQFMGKNKCFIKPGTAKLLHTPVQKNNPFFRYAAAAVFIGVIAFGIIKLTDRQ